MNNGFDLHKFKGIIVAMYACYGEDGEIDPQSVKKLARHYAGSGVTGLYVGGSSGEGLLQTAAERKLALEAVMEEVGGELTVVAHIGAPSTRESVDLAIHAESVGADAISAVPSVYYRLSPESVERHWQAIIDSTSLPFIMYHIPQTTGFRLSPELFAKMAAQPKVIGVKISADSTYELQRFKRIGGTDFLVFNGPDEQYLAGRCIGADGGIGGTYGVMPELFLQIERCFVEGRLEEARHWQYEVNDMIGELLKLPSLYGGCKAIMKLRGFDCGPPRSPIMPVSSSETDLIAKLNDKILRNVAIIRKRNG